MKRFNDKLGQENKKRKKNQTLAIGISNQDQKGLKLKSLPVELLGLIFSFSRIQELHSVVYLISRDIFGALPKIKKFVPISYDSHRANTKPLQLYGTILRSVCLSSTTDEMIEILQISQTLTRFETYVCRLKYKKYSELPFLRELQIWSCGHSVGHPHRIGDFFCPRLIELTYDCPLSRNDPFFSQTCDRFSLQLEKLTINRREANKWFPDSPPSRKWSTLKSLNIFGVGSPWRQIHFVNFLPKAPLTKINLDLSIATKADLQSLKAFPLKNLHTSFPQEINNFPLLLSTIPGVTKLSLTDLGCTNLKCLETLSFLQHLSIRFAPEVFITTEAKIYFGNLKLKSLLLLNLQVSEICVEIKEVECLILKTAMNLLSLPFCDTAKSIKITNAEDLNLVEKGETEFGLKSLQQLSLIDCTFFSENFLKFIKEASKLRFLIVSTSISRPTEKKQMKLICQKLGIFLSWSFIKLKN